MSETGSVKFTCQQVPVEIGAFAGFAELNEYRRKLRELGMIGVDANGVGFGNLSIRDGATSRFYITGSATGGTADLIPSDYARVVAYDFAKNWLRCEGSDRCVIRIAYARGRLRIGANSFLSDPWS